MEAFDITLTSKHGQTRHVATSDGVAEQLRKIGLEWKLADQFYDSEVIITIRPSEYMMREDKQKAEHVLAEISDLVERLR